MQMNYATEVNNLSVYFPPQYGYPCYSGRKNVLRKLLRTPYRRLKAGFSVRVLTVFDCVCLSLREFWLRLNEMHKVWTFSSRKAFLPFCGFCFSSLENYFGLGTTNVKGKRIIPSVWGGIKSFQHFQRGQYFSDCAFDLFVSWFRLLSPGWIKTRLYSLISKYFFTCPDLFPLHGTSFILLFSQRTFCAP